MNSKVPENFQDPPSFYRPWPLFVLNDEYEPGAGEARLTELLTNLARVGYGGVFLHPRPGLITEYLSPRWFEIVRHCVSECVRLGLIPALYDENSYPSGFAGGHVPSLLPETELQYVVPKTGSWPELPPTDAIVVYRMEKGIPEKPWEKDLSQKGDWMAFVIEPGHKSPWHGGFAYTSLLHPATAPLFLRTTHDRYRMELGDDLWKACAAIFTDEPHLPANAGGPWGSGLHFNATVQSEFAVRNGYRIEERLSDLYFDSVTSAATRFDFYETTHNLWLKNFAVPILDWCKQNAILLTGHYLEHDWPCPYATPGHVHLLSLMDWPGTDLLDCFALAGHDYGDTQNLDPAVQGAEPHALYFLKQVQSIANQLGKERVLNETWGAGGHDSTPVDWLRIGRYLAVHGVNLFVPHFSTTTIRGARKNDNPQFFSEQSPWFDALKPLNDELGRLSWINTQGRSVQRILVIDPLTTGYCLSAKSDCLDIWPSDASLSQQLELMAATQLSIRPLRHSVSDFCQSLSDAQCDFDIGDEYVLADTAKLVGDRLQVGLQTYEFIVLPPGLKNLRSATVELLRRFVLQGGKIFGLQPTETWRDGRANDWSNTLGVRWSDSSQELLEKIQRHVPPRFRGASPFPSGVAHSRRVVGDNIFYLVVNSSLMAWSGSVILEDEGGVSEWDPSTGTIAAFSRRLDLPPGKAKILCVDPSLASAGFQACFPLSPAAAQTVVKTDFLSAEPIEKNVMVLDTASLTVGSKSFSEQLVYETNRIYWEHHGMETNGWNAVVQFRDDMLRKSETMPFSTGGCAAYRLKIGSGVELASIEVAFECPEQWKLRINGVEVSAVNGDRWLDYRIVRVGVGYLLDYGQNLIELVASPFDVRQEVHQIYVLGEFSVVPDISGFHLEKHAAPMNVGPWKDQGMPFYDRKVRYDFNRPSGAGCIRVGPTQWHGSVIEICCGSRRAEMYGPEVALVLDESDPLEFFVIATGLPFNLLGPWHKPGLLPKHGWSNFWHGEDVSNDPQSGHNYRFLELGLLEAPDWIPDEVNSPDDILGCYEK